MRRDEALVADIVIYARKALRDAAGHTRATFEADETLQNAAIRYLEVIGEAAARASETIRTTHPEVPWQSMAGMRNRLIHEYGDIDLDEVWITIVEDLPVLLEQVVLLFPEEDLDG
jgi:uncharacterized protein with HEPN domain